MSRLLRVTALLAALALPLAAEELVLDSFDYPAAAAAQAAWKPAEQSQPAGLELHPPGTALKMICDFQQNDRRAVYDLAGKWDLTPYNRISFQVRTPVPAALRVFILYLRSGEGWFYTQCNTNDREWLTVDVAKTAFSPEGKPAGWHDISGVRLSAWRGAAADTVCLVDNLKACRDRVVLLKADRRNDAEEYVEELLRGYSIRVRVLREHEFLASSGAAESAVFILACNPDLSAAACAKLAGCVQAGGKVVAFRHLPPPLAGLLHLRTAAANPGAPEGRQIRFSGGAVKGRPESLALAPTPVTPVDPAGDETKVLGRWCDVQGKDTGMAAVLLAPSGAFVSAVLGAGDGLDHGRLLLALLSHFAPEVGTAAGQAAAESATQIGHLARGQLPEWVAAHAPKARQRDQARADLLAASGCDTEIAAALKAGDGLAAADASLRRNRDLERAYLLGHTSRAGEFRAWWEHSGMGGGYPGGWEQAMEAIRGAGFNAVITNSLRGGSALYPSKLLPVSPEVAQGGDQIAAAVAAGRKYGVEVHIWKVCFWDWGAPKEFTEQMRAAGRLQVSRTGETNDWLCPSHPENRELEIASLVEVATNYAVAGVHFDYIRYPGADYCFCAGCRSRFSQDTGSAIATWPADVDKPEVAPRWSAWRAEQITTIVRETARRVRQVRPGCKISAAVFSDYPGCATGVGQDWVRWAREGYVDFLCPMDYSSSDATFAQSVARQLRYLDGAVPLYPGIGASSLNLLPFTAARVAGQIHLARQLGADGFTVFNFGQALSNKLRPGLGAGITAVPTDVPHHGPRLNFRLSGKADDRLWGTRVAPGEVVRCAIRPQDPATATIAGTVAVEDTDGTICQDLGPITANRSQTDVNFRLAKPGLYRLAVHGIDTGLSQKGPGQPFVVRSQLLICGPLEPAVAQLLGAE